MKLENRFAVPVHVEQAWKVLLDVERIAPCVPGAPVLKRLAPLLGGLTVLVLLVRRLPR